MFWQLHRYAVKMYIAILQKMWVLEYMNSYKKLVKLHCAKYRVVCVHECMVATYNSTVILDNITINSFSQCLYESIDCKVVSIICLCRNCCYHSQKQGSTFISFGSCRYVWMKCFCSVGVGPSFIQHCCLDLDLKIVRKT